MEGEIAPNKGHVAGKFTLPNIMAVSESEGLAMLARLYASRLARLFPLSAKTAARLDRAIPRTCDKQGGRNISGVKRGGIGVRGRGITSGLAVLLSPAKAKHLSASSRFPAE